MKITIKNVGKIKRADVAIDGITVIAGENDTGKSTVGKALFAVFNSFYELDNRILRDKKNSIESVLENIAEEVTEEAMLFENEPFTNKIIENASFYINEYGKLEKDIMEWLCSEFSMEMDEIDKENLNDEINRIIEKISISDEKMIEKIIDNHMLAEFSEQINNIYSEDKANVELNIKNQSVNITFQNNRVSKLDRRFSLKTEVVYFDDPFVLDDGREWRAYRTGRRRYWGHRGHMRCKVFSNNNSQNIVDEIIVNNKFEQIYKKIEKICDGNIVIKGARIGYQKKDSDRVLDVANLSTGLKMFVILKSLLTNGTLEQNGTIILDEPEIHLHPEWQLIFAELIVLIQKKFGMHILLNTHSPYFLNAIEVYSTKYGIEDKCKYYMTNANQDGSVIEDVSDNIEKIYKKLAVRFDLERNKGLYFRDVHTYTKEEFQKFIDNI